MSYLDTPRLHLAGRFFTDPSTINNDPGHYEPDCERPSPWQEPEGQHRFQLVDVSVRTALDDGGRSITDDPVVGAGVESRLDPCPARIVDLDVYQQAVSTIFGLKVRIALPGGQAIEGTMDPATLNNMFMKSVLPTRDWSDADYGWGSYGGDQDGCGGFQTVIRIDAWPDTPSAILNRLRAVTATDDGRYLLSFRFVLDNYDNVAREGDEGTPGAATSFRHGRFIGTIGPYFQNEPMQAPGPRWLRARPFPDKAAWYVPTFNDTPFKVDVRRKKLVIDLGNALCRQAPGGAPVDLGTLQAVIRPPDGPAEVIGPISTSGFMLTSRALVAELDLTDTQLERLAHSPLVLTTSRTDIGPPEVLAEDPSGLFFAVEQRVMRLAGNPGAQGQAAVYVTQWGNPVAHKQLAIEVVPVTSTTNGKTAPPTYPGDTKQAFGVFEPPTSGISPTDARGVAKINLRVLKDPGRRTTELDGQLYFVVVYDPAYPPPDLTKVDPRPEQMLSCVAWSHYPVDEQPTWEAIRTIMAPYAKLYPSMTNLIDLADEDTFTIFALNPPWSVAYKDSAPGPLGLDRGAIAYYLTRPFTDPRYMPITRDLSPDRLMTVLYYIKNLQALHPSAPPPTAKAPAVPSPAPTAFVQTGE